VARSYKYANYNYNYMISALLFG